MTQCIVASLKLVDTVPVTRNVFVIAKTDGLITKKPAEN